MKKNLSYKCIDAAINEVVAYLENKRVRKADVVATRVSVEETLLNYRQAFGEDAEFELKLGRNFSKFKIAVVVTGDSYDPMSEYVDEGTAFMRSALTMLNKRGTWAYQHRKNVVTFNVPKIRLPEWVHLVVAVIMAIISGVLIGLMPAATVAAVQSNVVQPVMDTFLGFLNAVAGPMIFLSVVWGIYSMGDADTFNTIGKKLTRSFVIYIVLFSVVCDLITLSICHLNFGQVEHGSEAASVFNMVLDIVPDNLFTPFSSGNTLQILFVAIVVGVAMIKICEKSRNIASIIEELNNIVQEMMGFISNLIPLFIYLSVFNIILTNNMESLKISEKFIIISFVAYAVILIGHTVLAAVLGGKSPKEMWTDSLDPFLLGLTTASSSAAFAANVSSCINKHHISEKYTYFGVPFLSVLYKPGVSATFFAACLSVAEMYGVEVSVLWVVTGILMCALLSAATPPIPGGSTASFTIIFIQLGLPTESLAIILGINILLDFMHTSTNMFGIQCLMLNSATKNDLLTQ